MKLVLKDVETNVHDAMTGSCDLCMSIETISEPVFVFEDESGNVTKVKGYYWEFGHYSEILVDNVVDFAGYVSNHNFKDPEFDLNWLYSLIDDYEYFNYLMRNGEEDL